MLTRSQVECAWSKFSQYSLGIRYKESRLSISSELSKYLRAALSAKLLAVNRIRLNSSRVEVLSWFVYVLFSRISQGVALRQGKAKGIQFDEKKRIANKGYYSSIRLLQAEQVQTMRRTPQKVAGGQNKPVFKTTWERVSVPITVISVIVAGLLGLFAYYQSQNKEIWEGRLNQAKEQLEIKTQEFEKAKQDLKVYVEKEAKKPVREPEGEKTTESSPRSFQVRVMKSDPLSFDADLSITITDLKYNPNLKGYAVTATVKHEGLPEMYIKDAIEGYKVTYPKENGYDIQLLKADSISAKFSIRKNHN